MGGIVGELAKWTIDEFDKAGMRKRLWKAPPCRDGWARTADDASGGVSAPTAAEALYGDDVANDTFKDLALDQ